jgi:beta-galactosidase
MLKIFEGFHRESDYQNQYVTQINRAPSHSRWEAYESLDQAKARTGSKYVMSLDGKWDFLFAESPEGLPADFMAPAAKAAWKPIAVPGNWELQGWGKPVYLNTLYPFKDSPGGRELIEPSLKKTSDIYKRYNPPFVPTENACGVYRRRFSLPTSFEERPTFIEFGGVESAYYLWINGRPVGYSQDSKLASGFEITGYLVPGENTVTVAVLRFSDGSWLEDQDYFHLSGIFRSVRLVAKPRLRIQDFKVDAEPDGTGGGRVRARCFVNRAEGFADCRVRLRLFDAAGALLAQAEKPFATATPIFGMGSGRDYRGMRPISGSAGFELKVENVLPWDFDRPRLYTAVFSLVDPNGNECDFEGCRVGFRKILIENNVITLNGKRVVFRGVNRHEHGWPTGRVVSRERMIEEIILMKRLNFNAVRTCHYPDSPVWYDLCDEYGLMIVCETNLETHGLAGTITNDPEWAEAMLERARRMVLTHKNHPSIVSWSLGNESGYGPGHASMANWIREYDGTRLVQYENNDPGSIASDIKCTMYPPRRILDSMIADNRDRRPIVMVEYAYQISNATGHFEQFNQLAEKYEIFQGGFVWDWQDKCLPARDKNGAEFFGFGGDFGEDLVDWVCPEFMCANGVVLPDLTPKPCAWEIKQGQAPFIVELVNRRNGCFLLKNRSQGIGFDQISVEAEYLVEGVRIERREIALPDPALLDADEAAALMREEGMPEGLVPPVRLSEGDLPFTVDLAKLIQAPHEAYLTLKVRTAVDFPWAPKGHEIASYQFEIRGRSPIRPKAAPKEKLSLEKKGDIILVRGEGFEAEFDCRKNLLGGYRKNGVHYIIEGGNERFTRGRSGLHLEEKWWGESNGLWAEVMPGKLERRAVRSASSLADGVARVEFENEIEGKAGMIRSRLTYTVYGDGEVEVEALADIDSAFVHVPRVGLDFTIAEGFERLSWYGRGPGESYCDRKLSAPVGSYVSTVEATHFPFVPVSHNGSHSDTRRFALESPSGGKLIVSGAPFSFDAHHNTVEDYWKARHEHELVRRKEIYLTIDGAMAGIGGDMFWSTELDEAHKVRAGQHRFGFRMRFE